jgi:hypothetical protein
LLNRQALDQGGFLPVFQVRYNSPAFTNISLDVRAFLGVGPENDATLKAFARNSMAELLKSSSQTIPPKPGDAKTLYDTVILARRTGLDTALLTPILNQQATALVDGLKDKQPLDGTQLTEAYYLTQLVQFEAPVVSKLERNLLLMRNQIGAFGANGRYNLQYTWLALSTLDNLKSSVLSMQARKQSAAWIRQHQTTDGGYKEAGIVNVYSSYWAVDSLRVLEGKVRPDSKLIDWLRALKQPGGGIKPTPDPISGSDLTATYYALKVAQWMGFTLLS